MSLTPAENVSPKAALCLAREDMMLRLDWVKSQVRAATGSCTCRKALYLWPKIVVMFWPLGP